VRTKPPYRSTGGGFVAVGVHERSREGIIDPHIARFFIEFETVEDSCIERAWFIAQLIIETEADIGDKGTYEYQVPYRTACRNQRNDHAAV